MSTRSLPMQFDEPAQRHAAARIGMWVFLASEVLFFGVLFFAYSVARLRYGDAFVAANSRTDLVLGTINTAVLLTSSLTVALAVQAMHAQRVRTGLAWLGATCLLGATFLALKALEYRHDIASHLVPGAHFALPQPGAEAFFTLYFLMTGWHAAHLTIGIAIIAVMAIRIRRDRQIPEYGLAVEIAGLYWHLVDIVWVFLYPLLYLVGRQ